MEIFNLDSDEFKRLVEAARQYCVAQLAHTGMLPVEQSLAQAAYRFALMGSTYGRLWSELVVALGFDIGVTDATHKRAVQRVEQLVGKEQAHKVLVSQCDQDRIELAKYMGLPENTTWSELMVESSRRRDAQQTHNRELKEALGRTAQTNVEAIEKIQKLEAQIKELGDPMSHQFHGNCNKRIRELEAELVAMKAISYKGPLEAVCALLGVNTPDDVEHGVTVLKTNNANLKEQLGRVEEERDELEKRIKIAQANIGYVRESLSTASNDLDYAEGRLKGSMR